MSRAGSLRRIARLMALAPAFLIGLPLQALAVRLNSRAARILPLWFHRYACRVLGIRRQVSGPLPAGGSVLLVANHVSWLDIIVIGATLPISFVARADLAGWPGAGLLARLQRSVFVDRTRRKATRPATGEIAQRLAGGEAIVLFAEGTTSDGNRVLPFRPALLAAADGSAPVQPLVLHYRSLDGLPLDRRTRPLVAWYGDMDLVPHLGELFRRGPVDVALHFGSPVHQGGDRKMLARRLEAEIRATAARLRLGRDV
ncbi:MAG TPA: lysophospholipid acyltransferase family protein [Beijerinckiaceae bacterium]|nr:lysophospholipid acyltransferase family protein [Beijerinckiaceae bacterium]